LSALENFIEPLMVVDFTVDAAKKAAKVRHHLQQQGKPIGAYDIQVVAIALSLNMTLLTNNTREFARVEKLKLENWIG